MMIQEGDAMRRWLRRLVRTRFRMRTALVLVAAMAVLSAAMTRWVPYLLWRLRLERAIVGKVEGDAAADHLAYSNPSFQLYHDLNDAEAADLRREPGRVVDRLLRDVAEPGDPRRREDAGHALGLYLDEVKGTELPGRFVSRGVALLASGKLPIGLETDLASAIVRQAFRVGISPADRRAFLRGPGSSSVRICPTRTMRRSGPMTAPNSPGSRRSRSS